MTTTTSFSKFIAPLRELPRADFDLRALELFEFQFELNRPYRLICESRGITPARISHWTEVPAVPTAAFKELQLSCLPTGERTTVFHSSGTTAQKPGRHYHSSASLTLYEKSLLASFRENVVQMRPVTILSLTPGPAETPHSSLVYMFETIRRELGAPDSVFAGRATRAGEWVVDFSVAQKALDQACQNRAPICVLGTAFSFVHLLDHLQQQSRRFILPSDSRVMETGGYKGKSREMPRAELHRLLRERLGVSQGQIVCEYGMSELSSQAYAGPLFHFPLWVRCQIISPETGRELADGETGLIRVFDLANVYSVMAVQTEDLGIKRGTGFDLLGRATLAEPRGCSLMSQ